MRLRKFLSAAAALAVAALCTPDSVLACSMCRCSDPVFSALGQGLYTHSGFKLAVDWSRSDQSEGPPDDFEAQVRNTMTLTMSYSWQERLTFVAQLPYVWAHQNATDGVENTTGLGDPAFYVYARLWSSNFGQGLGRRAWLSAVFAVKTPWGENNATEDGERLDEHVQPGTGATNLTGGLSFLYLFDAASSIYTSAAYTGTGRNDVGYRYGNNFQVNVVYDRKIADWIDGLFEVNFLDAKEDQVDQSGLQDPNTGGQSLYLTPRIAIHVARGFVVRMGAQFPVWKNLNGIQDIQPTYSAGLTYVF
ncbi:MAG TPA: hypothetical protein VMN82_10540 [Thermoanaerobaculia bacterium]|nr:hypothetical protein [Thermoanaerobaculia bacterium]